MQRGSAGQNVRQLQQILIALGYLDDVADGVFGTKTQTAVKDLQSDNNMEATGQVTNELMHMLVEGKINAYDPYLGISRGASGKRVTNLQNRLKELGYMAGKADGVYGTGTYNAVKLFQQQTGLPQTGNADSETLKLLFAEDAPKC